MQPAALRHGGEKRHGHPADKGSMACAKTATRAWHPCMVMSVRPANLRSQQTPPGASRHRLQARRDCSTSRPKGPAGRERGQSWPNQNNDEPAHGTWPQDNRGRALGRPGAEQAPKHQTPKEIPQPNRTQIQAPKGHTKPSPVRQQCNQHLHGRMPRLTQPDQRIREEPGQCRQFNNCQGQRTQILEGRQGQARAKVRFFMYKQTSHMYLQIT